MIEIIEILLVAGDLKLYYPELYELAKKFHESYEKNSKLTGWNTNENCQVDFEDLPKKNLKTMLLTVYEFSNGTIKNEV